MVSGRYPSAAYTSVEVIFANGTRYCSLPDLPKERYRHTQNGLTICGGRRSDNCITLSDDGDGSTQWTQSHTLIYTRDDHTSWPLGDGTVVLMGGEFSPNTTEIIATGFSSTTEGFPLIHDSRYV